MAQRRSNTLFLALNVLISLGVALLVIGAYYFAGDSLPFAQSEEDNRARPTIIIVVTSTPDPRQLPAEVLQATLDAQSGTLVALERDLTNANAALAQAQDAAVAAAANTNDTGNTTAPEQQVSVQPTLVQSSDQDLPTIDPALIPALPTRAFSGAGGAGNATTATPEDGCIHYFVQSGDTASTIATRFEVSLADFFVLNGINDRTILQIGDELLIPGDTCQQEVPPTETPTPQPTFNLTIVAPTATLPPIAEDSQVQIVQVLNAGDITTEQVEIQNLGGEINLRGWVLSDSQGNLFTFPDVRLVPGSVIRISSRVGTNTPGFLYWNQNRSVWELGEVATLSDAEGVVQSIYTLQGQVINFDATPTP